jgi:hypothetical protein
MKVPSVTGRKPKVPQGPASDTFALAFWRTVESASRRHCRVSSASEHPAASEKSS